MISTRTPFYRDTGDPYDGPQCLGYFNSATAQQWAGHRRGSTGQIDINTHDDTHSQTLVRTAGGRWLLYHNTQRANEENWHEEISADRAKEWLIFNDRSDVAAELLGPIPDEVGSAPVSPATGDAKQMLDLEAHGRNAIGRQAVARFLTWATTQPDWTPSQTPAQDLIDRWSASAEETNTP